MKTRRCIILFFALSLSLARVPAQEKATPLRVFTGALNRLVSLVEPAANSAPQTVSATLRILEVEGLPKSLAGRTADLVFQAPEHLLLSVEIDKHPYRLGRNGQVLWIYAPAKHFGLIGTTNVARFASAPEKKDVKELGLIKLPLPKEQILLLPLLMKLEGKPDETIDQVPCHVVQAAPQEQAVQALKIPAGQLQLWIRDPDQLPAQIEYTDGHGMRLKVALQNVKFSDAWPAEQWKLPESPEDKIETVALSHLTRFLRVMMAHLSDTMPTLGPATGERRVVATEGKGRLELVDGTHVLYLQGTPEEMGHQQGILLKKQVRNLVDRILYGVGVGSSFVKGRWFIGEIEDAQRRLQPYMDTRYVREMDAMADAVGAEHAEMRLANIFPELFHCSGFALFGAATVDGHLYHGRILDYLRGLGLEQNAVVTVVQPDEGNAWVNVGYAGFTGSVTAMNAKQIAMGEMGGRGEGNWDGKPMAQLVREVMEKANTLDEAVEIMRRGPRTCEYYYVISDGKSHRAVGIAATPTSFQTVWPGQSHPLLPHAIKDAVILSAGDRYETLAQRVQSKYGKIDAAAARDLMTRPVCMTSNIHSALFAPDTLDFWVANADSHNVASHTRYTHYNLRELLRAPSNN